MTCEALDGEDWYEPQRDEAGRFKKGSSGNPRGRRRKRPDPEWSVEESFARAFAEEVSVSGRGGSQKMMALRDLLVASAVHEAVNANGKDKFYIIERLAKLQYLRPPAEQEPEEGFSEEDRRLLATIRRELMPLYCQCEKPILKATEQQPTRDDFRFE